MRSILASAIAGALVALSGIAADAATVKMPTTPVTISAYATALRHINPQMQFGQSRDLAKHLLNTSSHWRIDPTMLVALVTVESRWRTDARSSVGAIGLGQLMPGTASALHVNPNIPTQNLSGAARTIRFESQSLRVDVRSVQCRPARRNGIRRHPALQRNPKLRRARTEYVAHADQIDSLPARTHGRARAIRRSRVLDGQLAQTAA
jgi:hypothetical protein